MTVGDEHLQMGAKSTAPVVCVNNASVEYGARGTMFGRSRGTLKAVDDVSLHIDRGETIGLVGETGCGKSTLGRAVIRLRELSSGSVCFDGIDLGQLNYEQLRKMRRRMQFVFQDPYGSLNPRQRIRSTLREPMRVHGLVERAAEEEKISELLEVVGLNPSLMSRYPNELSGGQRQRVGIARALAVQPEFIVFDEPISALDVSLQGQILNLLMDLRESLQLTYLFIAHDLAVVRRVSDRVAVMHLGKIVETGSSEDVYGAPSHPYTRALLSAVPVAEPAIAKRRQRVVLSGELPNPLDPPRGCRFHPRCWLFERLGQPQACRESDPALAGTRSEHLVACHFVAESLASKVGARELNVARAAFGTPVHLRKRAQANGDSVATTE